MKHFTLAAVLALSLAALLPVAAQDAPPPVTITLAGYAVPREAYDAIIPLFQHFWLEQTGQQVTILESYQASGAQSRAIMGGLEADVAALSFEPDITRLVDAGLVSEDWNDNAFNGIVTESLVVFAVRPGNPLSIHDWTDVITEGVEVITPDPATSGGAQWNILALYGAAKRGAVAGVPKDDDAAATAFLKAVLKNVTVMDKGARESITNFEQGVGDVAITYENEVAVGRMNGQTYELVIPQSTILIENPLAVVDTYADKHGTRKAAEAFVQFLLSKEAQTIFAQYGLRSVDAEVAKATAAQFPSVPDLFTIEYFNGWKEATPTYFGDSGVYTKAIAEVQQ